MLKACIIFCLALTTWISPLLALADHKAGSQWVIAFDCWGVLYANAYSDFLKEHEPALKKFLEKKKKLEGEKVKYPDYYKNLARAIDLREITDEYFYGILAKASGESAEAIKRKMNDVHCLHKGILEWIQVLKNQGYYIILVADTDREFLKKFLDHQNVGKLFDNVFTSSELKSYKATLPFWEKISAFLATPLNRIIVIDDSLKDIKALQKFGLVALHYNDVAGVTSLQKKLDALTHN